MAEKTDKHLGKFVGGYLTEEQVKKIDAVAEKYGEVFGENGRNRTRAIRYIIDCFDPAWLQHFPKNQPFVSKSAQVTIN